MFDEAEDDADMVEIKNNDEFRDIIEIPNKSSSQSFRT
jgi:hypothetical protein